MRCKPSWSWPSQILVILCRLLIIPYLPPPARYAWFRLKLSKFRFVRHVPDSILPQRQKAVATATVSSVPLPVQDSIVEIFTGHITRVTFVIFKKSWFLTKFMSGRRSPSYSELRPTTKNSASSRRRFSGSQTEVPSSAPIIL